MEVGGRSCCLPCREQKKNWGYDAPDEKHPFPCLEQIIHSHAESPIRFIKKQKVMGACQGQYLLLYGYCDHWIGRNLRDLFWLAGWGCSILAKKLWWQGQLKRAADSERCQHSLARFLFSPSFGGAPSPWHDAAYAGWVFPPELILFRKSLREMPKSVPH